MSAVADPFAEVTVLTLPEGASCVLEPHALAAAVQPIGRPLRLTSHWRLRSLNAWLTMQLRYLVFHGPCRLVIKGGRGVRVERAERGRIFGQAQVIGFPPISTIQSRGAETFWPYFLGYEQLFKDKVEAGEGVLMIEEAPMAGRKKEAARRGVEDVFEVMTKALGIYTAAGPTRAREVAAEAPDEDHRTLANTSPSPALCDVERRPAPSKTCPSTARALLPPPVPRRSRIAELGAR